jgi:multisubunit Na+/H+ antiporter MnhB subunit
MIGLTAVLTVLAITWAGIQMILATGEEEKFKKARHTMIYAFIGLLVAGLAYGAVTLITNLQLNNFL